MTIRRTLSVSLPALLLGLAIVALTPDGSAQSGVMTADFPGWALVVDVPNVGPIVGKSDLQVRHPTFISRRPPVEPLDPTDPVNQANAWMTQEFTNLYDLDGNPVAGSILLEYVAVPPSDFLTLEHDGFSVMSSSGSFVFALIRQTVTSPEVTAAFGIVSIDNGAFIKQVDTVQGICG